MTSLFHPCVLSLRQQLNEPDPFGIDLKFETICNSVYLHSAQGRILDIRNANLVLKNPFSVLWPLSENSTLDDAAVSNAGLDILYSPGSIKAT